MHLPQWIKFIIRSQPACHRWKICFNRSRICISNWGARVPRALHLLWKICPHLLQNHQCDRRKTPHLVVAWRRNLRWQRSDFSFLLSTLLGEAISSRCQQTSSLSSRLDYRTSSNIFCSTFCGCGVLNNSEVESLLYRTQYFVFTPVVCRYQLLTKAVKNMGAVFNCSF